MLDTVMTTLQITVILSFQNQRKILVTCVYHSSFKLPKSEKNGNVIYVCHTAN